MTDSTDPRLEGIVCAARHLLWRLAEGMPEDGADVPERLQSAAALALERFEEPGVPWAENSPRMTAEGEQAAAEWLHWLREADSGDATPQQAVCGKVVPGSQRAEGPFRVEHLCMDTPGHDGPCRKDARASSWQVTDV